MFSEVSVQARDCVLGTFKQAVAWPLPEGLSVSDWRNVLEEVWREQQAPFPAGPSCQEKWDEFMVQLDSLFRSATTRVLALTSDPLLKRKLGQQANFPRQKGSPPQWSQRPWVGQGPRTDDETLQVRKLRRRLARNYELLRWAKRTTSQRESGLPQARALAYALGFPSLPEPSSLRKDLPEEIAELHTLVQQQRKTRLKAWKDGILNEPGALGRWLRIRQAPPVTRVTSQGSSADSPTSGAAMIHAFWQDFWRSRALTAPTPEELAQALVENGIRYQGGIDWEPPDLEHLVHTFRTAKGSGGVDRWHASELRHLPVQAIGRFRELMLSFEAEGVCPRQSLNVEWWFWPNPPRSVKGILLSPTPVPSASSPVFTARGLRLGFGPPVCVSGSKLTCLRKFA